MTWEILLTVLVVAVAVFTVFDMVRTSRRRRRKRAEAKADEFAVAVLAAIMAPAVAQVGELVKPADIKYGDKVCWSSADHSKHVHYVAGFDGDPGPSADGVHMRPFELRRKK